MMSVLGVAAVVMVAAAGPDVATISGVVHDEQGGAIPRAHVEIVCRGVKLETSTGPDGRFTLADAPVGHCTVTADAPYFGASTVEADAGGAAATLVLSVNGFASSVQVTATRGVAEDRTTLPQPTSVLTRSQIDARAYQLLPQALREEPGILLQQTTSAQASPVIRGFTGSANAYLVDGVRFNLSTWRGGPSQYLAWVDAAAVDRLEVVRGPGSVQYGSDAMGGTINVMSARPTYSDGATTVGGDVSATLGSAEKSSAGDVGIVVRGRGAAFRMGVGGRTVGDLRPGGGIDSHAAVTRFFGIESKTVNGSRLPSTGYDQSGGYLTGRIRAGAQGEVTTLFMHEHQTGASRYDRIDGGNGLYRSGFDPQRLDFGLVRYERSSTLGLDRVAGTVSINRQADGTFEQTRPTAVLDRQRAVNMAKGYQFDAAKVVGGRQHVSAGTELYAERVSVAFREQVNPLTGASVVLRPDIPDRTTYKNFGIFAQDAVDVVPGRLNVRGGLRYGHFAFHTKANPVLGVVDESVDTRAVTFQTGAIVTLSSHVSATFNVSRGFRAPNASDLGGIGLSGGGGFGITPSRAATLGGLVGTTGAADAVSTGQPIPALGPETLYAYEPGIRFSPSRANASFGFFDLEYQDTVQRRSIVFPHGVVGTVISGFEVVRQDASGLAYIAQDIRPIGTSINADKSRVRGIEMDGNVRLAERWSAAAYFAMSNGKLLSTGEPIRRMTPPIGGGRVRWGSERTWLEGTVQFARAQTRFNAGDLTDARIGAARTRNSIAGYFNGTATDLGLVKNGVLVQTGETLAQVQNRIMGTSATALLFDRAPGYVVFGARAGLRLLDRLDLTIIGDNLTDRNYRLYGSGVDSPGASLTLRTRYRF